MPDVEEVVVCHAPTKQKRLLLTASCGAIEVLSAARLRLEVLPNQFISTDPLRLQFHIPTFRAAGPRKLFMSNRNVPLTGLQVISMPTRSSPSWTTSARQRRDKARIARASMPAATLQAIWA